MRKKIKKFSAFSKNTLLKQGENRNLHGFGEKSSRSKKALYKKIPSLTIAIPAYNEEENLEWVLRDILSEAPKQLSDFEIVIVNDGSTDNTGKIADNFAKKNKKIKVVHKKNGGYGEAMLRGIKEAKKEFVAYMPADGQFLVKDMLNCFPLMDSSDLVLGYRGKRKDYNLYRLILSHGYLFILKVLFGISYKDVNWLNIWRSKEIKSLKTRSRGVFLLAEIILKFKKKGLRISEAKSFYRVRRGGEVKNAKLRIAVQTLIDLLSFKFSSFT